MSKLQSKKFDSPDETAIPGRGKVSGRLGVKMDDGTEQEFGPGDISLLPPGHNAWVVGKESAVIIEQTPTEY